MYQGAQTVREQNPKERANIFSLLTYTFASDIFAKSKKKELDENDLYKVVKNAAASKLGDRMEKEWQVEESKDYPSLTKVIFKIFWKEYLYYGLLNLCFTTTFMVINPLAVGKLVSYFSPNSDQSLTDACFHAAVIVLSNTIISVYGNYYQFGMSVLGLRLKASLCSLMYRKCLRLTSAALSRVTNGKIVTMMSKDVNIFEWAMSLGHDLFTGLCKMLAMAYIIYGQIGVSSFIGTACLFLLIPLQVWMATIARRMRYKNASITDDRLRHTQEVLISMKFIKFYSWEPYFTKIINYFRWLETKKLRQLFWLKSLIYGIGSISHRISFFICIVSYSLLGNTLTAEKAFVVVDCYSYLYYFLAVALPFSVCQFAEAKCSLKRIKGYLLAEEVDRFNKKGSKIVIINLSAGYLKQAVLHEISLRVDLPILVGLTGNVACGKSSLLKVMMGELNPTVGTVESSGCLSYASQEPWLFPATIRENILFGSPYNAERYETVVKVCGLNDDLQAFPRKDFTIVTDKGLNFSRGQQMRVHLARAVYKEAEVYLLDDVLSSLDAKTAKHVFDECILGFLGNKLRFLVTHNKQFLTRTDRVVIMEEGRVKCEGTMSELLTKNVNFNNYTNVNSQILNAREVQKYEICNGDPSGHIYREHQQEGRVKWETYKVYFRHAGGWKLIPLLLVISFLSQSSAVYLDYYLTVWLKVEENVSTTVYNLTMLPGNDNLTALLEEQSEEREQTMIVYNFVIATCTASMILQLLFFFGIATRTSALIHNAAFGRIMGATMRFFDSCRSGNILNRLSKDVYVLDEVLPFAYFDTVSILFYLVSVLFSISNTNYIFAVPSLGLLVLLLYARTVYLRTSRCLRRLDGITRAPVIGYLNTSLEGLATIRAAGNQEVLIKQFDHHQDLNTSANYMFISVLRSFSFWLDMVCNFFSVFIIAIFLSLHGQSADVFAADVGLALTQSFGMANLLQWGIRQWCEIENTSVSVERITEYMAAEQEDLSGLKPKGWPKRGKLEYRGVWLRYTNNNNYTIRDVNMVIEPQQKVGIIGRSGAGKSSIIAALFRLYHVKGTVLIDDVDIKDIDLETLRGRISIIPQDPVMFEGTIRSNLDPNDEFLDGAIWDALEQVQLKSVVKKFPQGLGFKVESSGMNFSIGERQLFCLARAILRKNRILVLDEATANIDPITDTFIQATVKKLFAECTVMTIAHRIHTVIGCDKIIVVENGRVIEMDDPQKLLAKKTGIFYNLAKQSNLV